MCRKIAFFGLRAEILLARSQGLLDSRAGPFLGSVKKYWFFGEIFTSAPQSTGLPSQMLKVKSAESNSVEPHSADHHITNDISQLTIKKTIKDMTSTA